MDNVEAQYWDGTQVGGVEGLRACAAPPESDAEATEASTALRSFQAAGAE